MLDFNIVVQHVDFGCPLFLLSWEFAADLKKVKDKFDAAGVKLIAVGVGSANKARMLGERVSLFA